MWTLGIFIHSLTEAACKPLKEENKKGCELCFLIADKEEKIGGSYKMEFEYFTFH